jgi:hypothetical protein
MKFYVFRNPMMAIGKTWAEVDNGTPVHTGDLLERVEKLLPTGDMATVSDTVIALIGYLIRTGKVTCPLTLIYVDKDGDEHKIPCCTDGTTLRPFPFEEGFESIM